MGVAQRDHGGDWQLITGARFKTQKRESYGNLKYRIFTLTLSRHRTTTTKAERLNFTRWLKQFSACRLINVTADLVYSCITWYCIVYRYYSLLTYEFANPIRVEKGVWCIVSTLAEITELRNGIIFGCVRLCVCVFFFLNSDTRKSLVSNQWWKASQIPVLLSSEVEYCWQITISLPYY